MSKGTIWHCLFVICTLLHEESNVICSIFVSIHRILNACKFKSNPGPVHVGQNRDLRLSTHGYLPGTLHVCVK